MIYNDIRPKTFNEIKGQKIAKTTIVNQVKDLNAHSYIFAGLRGSGKTTVAKLFARVVNCSNPIESSLCNECDSCKEAFANTNTDIIKIDGASNNGVDDAKQIRKEIVYSPKRKMKVYIIDEAHRLSKNAFDALLKTIEEPPSHVLFIFCTTEYHKIPDTIKSRCITVNFSRIPQNTIKEHLKSVCKLYKYDYDDKGLELISEYADGSMRDALTLLENALSYGPLTYNNIAEVLCVVSVDSIKLLVKAIISKSFTRIREELDKLYYSGKDFNKLVMDLIQFFRDIMVYTETKDESLLKTSAFKESYDLTSEHCFEIIVKLTDLDKRIKETNNIKTLVEVYLVQISLVYGNENTPQKHISNKDKNKNTNFSLNVNTKEIDHNDYLIYKIKLINSFNYNDELTKSLVNATYYTNKNSIVIIDKSKTIKQNIIAERLKDITGKNLNIKIKYQ
ncbi:MAG: DNA polymerase III subunit gamma/tau [archaeon]